MTSETRIVRLKVVLDDVQPKVERWVVVPRNIRLDRLHQVLQAAIGWTDSHLWEIRFVRAGVGWGPIDPLDEDGPIDARKTTLQQALALTGAKSFTYLYDFGDGWTHTVKLDRFETLPAVLDPIFLASARGACPPEDCGGPWGYTDLLEAYDDPAHEKHDEAVQLLGPGYNPNIDPTSERQAAIEAVVESWSRRTRKAA
jgi:hypothetical protein